jgi:hypothetical protein
MGESLFEEDGKLFAELFGGIVTVLGCGAALYEPEADSGNTSVTNDNLCTRIQSASIGGASMSAPTSSAITSFDSTLHFQSVSGPAYSCLLPLSM